MKRLLFALLLSALLLTGCTGRQETTDATAAELGAAVADSQPADFTAGPLLQAGNGAEALETYLLISYGLEPSDWIDAALSRSEGFQADEVAVIQLSEQADAAAAEQGLAAYVERRKGEFTGYAPQEAAKLEGAVLLRQGRWLLLAVCPEPERAQAAFESAFQGGGATAIQAAVPSPSPTPVELPRYDTGPVVEAFRTGDLSTLSETDAAVLAACKQVMEQLITEGMSPAEQELAIHDVVEAFRTGDLSTLSETDAAVLAACKQVMEQLITEGMSPAEQELAIHDWMIDHTAYDETQQLSSRNHPYGLLVEGKAVCMGYANTFQLFMDLLEIPCLTVTSDTHAWNLVELDGAWYGVDVTWDDPLGPYEDVPAANEREHHRFFNVTDALLRQTDHRWDPDEVPEADGLRGRARRQRAGAPPLFQRDRRPSPPDRPPVGPR